MLAQRLDPIDAYRQRGQKPAVGSSLYRKKLRTRGLSIHARLVEKATEIFAGSFIVENIAHTDSKERE